MNRFDNSNALYETPKNFVRGDYIAWRNSSYVPDYPVADYTLAYKFRKETDEPAIEFTATGVADSGDYLFEILSATSAALEVGFYAWDLYVTRNSDSERITLDQGRLEIRSNKDSDSTDPRVFPRKMVAEIERAILARATNDQLDTLAYSIGVESSATRDTEKLKTWLTFYRSELVRANRKWRARRGLPHSGKIKVQF